MKLRLFLIILLFTVSVQAQDEPIIYVLHDPILTSEDHILTLDPKSGAIKKIITFEGEQPYKAQLRKDRKMMFIGNFVSKPFGVSVFDMEKEKVIKKLFDGKNIRSVSMSPSEQLYVLFYTESKMAVVDPYSLSVIKTIELKYPPVSIQFFADESKAFILTGELDTYTAHLLIYTPSTGKVEEMSHPTPYSSLGPHSIILSPDERFLYMGSSFQIQVYDIAKDIFLEPLPACREPYVLVITNDGKTIYASDFLFEDRKMVVEIDIPSRSITKSYNRYSTTRNMHISPNGKVLYLNRLDSIFIAIDLETKEELWSLKYGRMAGCSFFVLGDYNSQKPPKVSLKGPEAGEIVQGGKSYLIEWETEEQDAAVAKHLLEISTDAGATWSPMHSELLPASDRSFLWNAPKLLPDLQLRITAIDYLGHRSSAVSGVFSTGDRPTEDIEPPRVSISTPADESIFTPSQSISLTWNASDNVAVVHQKLSLSTDAGSNFTTLASLDADTRAYNLTLPDTEVPSGRLKLEVADAAGNTSSTQLSFSIKMPADTTAPQVSITSPQNNALYDAGQSITLNWSSSDDRGIESQSVKVSKDDGKSFESLAEVAAEVRSFVYQSSLSQKLILRVEAVDKSSNRASADVTVSTRPKISQASYSKPELKISGLGFSGSLKVFINGKDVSAEVSSHSNDSITLRGSRKRLGLNKTSNSLLLSVDGIPSTSFSF